MSESIKDYSATAGFDADVPDLAWLDRVQRVWLLPVAGAARLRHLADLCDLAQRRPDAATADGMLRWVRDRLRELAAEGAGR